MVTQDVIGNKHIKTVDLEAYYLDESNRKIVGIPFWLYLYSVGRYYFNEPFIERAYHKASWSYDNRLAAVSHQPKKYKRIKKAKKRKLQYYESLLTQGNLLMQLGEAPRLYSPEKIKATTQNILQYLHTQGFFNAKVTSSVKFKHQTAHVRYIIQENEPFILREITLNTSDAAIKSILEPYAETSLLQPGQRYDQELLEQERDRIYELLINKGYWGFKKNAIWFNVDNISQAEKVFIETVVASGSEGNPHPAYHIAHIDFSIVGEETTSQANETHTFFKGITFKNIDDYFSPHVLISKIPIQPGDIYSAQTIIGLQRRLTALGIFKAIHVTHVPSNEQHLRTQIQTSLLDKFQLEHEIGTDITAHSFIPFYRSAFKIRNLFHQLDILTTSLQFGVELGSVATDGSQFYNVNNFETNIHWQLPKLLLLLPIKQHIRLDRYEPVTKINVGYKFSNHPNYKSYNVHQELSFTMHFKHIVMEIAPINIRVVDFNVKPDFQKELQHRKQQGDMSYKKYDPTFDTNIKITTKSKVREKTLTAVAVSHSRWEITVESGGTAQNFINIEKLLNFKFACYRYLKGRLQYTYYIPLHASTMLVCHSHTGILYPYNQIQIAPQDKYFSIGGVRSLRAWGPKTVGPGSSQAGASTKDIYFNEKAGELLIQFNAELRQRIIGIVEGAIFLDMGNIWMLRKTTQVGEDFAWSRFYKELAVGTGVGVRLNFNVLVFLLDIGVKIYDPSAHKGARLFPKSMWEGPTFNIGLGYPF